MLSPSLLFDDLPPRAVHTLVVDGGHHLHIREFGRADGIAALVLHGGPGSGCSPLLWRVFDPARWRVICPDQRGAGGSSPRGSTLHNDTDALLDDLCRLRRHLGIERWVIVGGSWGAGLALACAAAEPDAVEALLLRSVFLARPADIDGFFGTLSLDQLHHDLTADDAATRQRAALRWWRHEMALGGTLPRPDPAGDALTAQVDRLRVQAHYLRHGCWLQQPALLERCDAVPPVPILLLHAPDDRICPPEGARTLHKRLPHARLQWVPGAGHDAAHPAMVAATVEALACYAERGQFKVAVPT